MPATELPQGVDLTGDGTGTAKAVGTLVIDANGDLAMSNNAAAPGFDVIGGPASGMTSNLITDPGNTGAIPVTASGTCNLVTAGAETRTLAAPTKAGQMLCLNFQTDGGDCVITCATGVNQAGNTSLTFADAGDNLVLIAGRSGANLRWRVVCNDGITLA